MVRRALLALAVGPLLLGCQAAVPDRDRRAEPRPQQAGGGREAEEDPGEGRSSSSSARPEREPEPEVLAGDGRPAAATLTVPELGLRDFPVRPYRGATDDARGTDIQNAGDLASPHGPRGGTGPGGVGNYQVTGHRLSSTQPFVDLPTLARGDEVVVESGASRYVYRIVATRETSFRSPASLRAQRAAVPGRPGVEPTRAMITLSTCATPEDHAEGNYWSDRFDNPEHRIDKIGVLVAIRRA